MRALRGIALALLASLLVGLAIGSCVPLQPARPAYYIVG